MPTAFLTGGTGFVGGHVARTLVAQGWNVRLLARDRAKTGSGLLAGLPVEVATGDLSERGLAALSFSGVDAVVHVAGLTKARSFDEYREVNARGTQRLVDAARRASPKALFVLVSSQAAAGPAIGGRPVGEADAAHPISWYGRSKREGEEAVENGWPGPWHVIRPGVVYGPFDRALLVYFQMAARGWVPVPAPNTRIQVVGGERAGMAIAKAAARPDLSGHRSFLCDPEPVTVGGLAKAIASGAGRKTRLFPVPSAVVRGLGLVESAREAVTGRSRPFNADKAREILAGEWLCDGRPLATALELPDPTPLSEGLRAAWEWYWAAGWLSRPGSRL
ncbi:MAG TPA: NAD-dependent epimerase/dehydratase family protein [Thermoanaerobaculia bacterium]|nr:NAD-dependent epimerase/dehydratase family protein [Thermoanaerobaculia bacterium]